MFRKPSASFSPRGVYKLDSFRRGNINKVLLSVIVVLRKIIAWRPNRGLDIETNHQGQNAVQVSTKIQSNSFQVAEKRIY